MSRWGQTIGTSKKGMYPSCRRYDLFKAWRSKVVTTYKNKNWQLTTDHWPPVTTNSRITLRFQAVVFSKVEISMSRWGQTIGTSKKGKHTSCRRYDLFKTWRSKVVTTYKNKNWQLTTDNWKLTTSCQEFTNGPQISASSILQSWNHNVPLGTNYWYIKKRKVFIVP